MILTWYLFIILLSTIIGPSWLQLINLEDGFFIQKNIVDERYEMKSPGVIRIKLDKLQERQLSIQFYKNHLMVNKLEYQEGVEEPVFLQQPRAIFAYYPEYYILLVEGYQQKDGLYKVYLNNDTLYLNHIDEVTIFETWEEHVKNSFVITSKENPLRKSPSDLSAIIDLNYNAFSFRVLKVNREWIYVVCENDCEGCSDNEEVSGWVRWRKNNTLLVELRYVC